MRAARLLQLLLILQNRGRQTSVQLASELEVSPRTILRDVDAMTEAGLPIIVHQGNAGGIELGFNYRTRLTGLSADEAEAVGILFATGPGLMSGLGMGKSAARAAAKLTENMPELTRNRMARAQDRFRITTAPDSTDPRIPALVKAIRDSAVVRLRYPAPDVRTVHPVRLELTPQGWQLFCAMDPDQPIPRQDWGSINISALRFGVVDDEQSTPQKARDRGRR